MTKHRRVFSIEFEGDKSDIPLLLSVQMQVKNDIYLKLLLSHDCFEPITAQDFPAIFNFWQENGILAGKLAWKLYQIMILAGNQPKLAWKL